MLRRLLLTVVGLMLAIWIECGCCVGGLLICVFVFVLLDVVRLCFLLDLLGYFN